MKQSRGSAAHLRARNATLIRLLPLLIALAIALVFGATASADEFPMTPEAAQEALAEGERVESQLTDPKAAEQLPHRDLERAQALKLLSTVFGMQIEGVAGVFSDLDIDHFLSDDAAIIDAGDQPEASGVVIGKGNYDGPALLESTVPLRTEGQSGEEETVDLGLEHTEGELQPATPLVEVGIPSELGEGIELPESEVGIALAGAPQERAPSIVNQTAAVYPEVANDTSLAVAPSPTGVETFTLLQSADAPDSSTYELTLPKGASLEATEDGGAEVSTGDEPLLRIFPPTALDAEGNNIPVSLTVSGDSFAVHAEPPQGASYPILVDPVVESYKWYGTGAYTNMTDWLATSNNQGILSDSHSALWQPGLDLRAVNGFSLPYNAKAHWAYSVPRFASDEEEFGTPPTSYISKMVTTNVFFVTKDSSLYPMMAAGIWDNSQNNWVSAWGHGGNTGNLENMGTTYTFSTTNQNAKQAISNELWAGEAHTMASDRETYVGAATIEVADQVAPKIGSFAPPEKWVNETAPGIPFSMTDTGLGVYEIAAGELTKSGGKVWTTKQGCIGIVSSPCPRTWSEDGNTSWLKLLKPSELPQGINKLQVVARDPVNNSSAAYEFPLKVDHTAPELNLSGSLTTSKFEKPEPQYVLVAKSSDGTEAAPQSGIASTEITMDGKVVDSTSAACATQNCAVTREWVLNSASYSPGAHTVVVKATDGVGLVTTKTIKVNLVADTAAPAITSMTGGLENAPSGWVEQKSYSLNASAADEGYGVTSIEFLMDGKVASKKTQSCPAGNCSGNLTTTLNMAAYKGGAHTAEYVVKDGAGNTTKKAWTVNVDPKGIVSTGEATNTLEAVEETTEATPVAPTEELIDPAEQAAGDDPGLEEVEGGFQSTGTPLKSFIPSEPSKGVTFDSPDGSIKIIEVGAASSSPPSITSEVASVDPNTATQVDSVVRPVYDGDQSFKVIRDVSAPTKYSWKLLLNAGQKLEQADAQDVAVFWSNGERALLISAEKAHDATGKEVPTELTAEGTDVVTLTVKHTSASFVYPVLAGPSFESSYTVPIVVDPTLPAGPEEPNVLPNDLSLSQAKQAIAPSGATSVDAPPPTPTGEAEASRIRLFEVNVGACSGLGCQVYNVRMNSGYYIRTSDGATWSEIPFRCEANVKKNWSLVLSVGFTGSGYHEPYAVLKRSGKHLISYCHYEVTLRFIPEYGDMTGAYSLMDWVYPNGFQQGVTREIEPEVLPN